MFSNNAFAVDRYKHQRELFTKVESAVKQGNRKAFSKHSIDLRDYPLYPYLQFHEIKSRLASAKESEILSFISHNRATPISEKLRYKWLDILARRGKWDSFIKLYQESLLIGSKRQVCNYGRALMHTEQFTELKVQIQDLWLVKFSQPSQCDAIFEWGFTHQLIDDYLVWQRLILAIDYDHARAKYLGRKLSKEKQKWYRLLLKAKHNPYAVLKSISSTFSLSPFATDIVLYAMKRLTKKNFKQAEKAWEKIRDACSECRVTYQIQHDFGIYTATLFKSELAYDLLSQLPEIYQTDISRNWLIRTGLHSQNWQQVFTGLNQLPEVQREFPLWRYWYAYALFETGKQQQALAIWKRLALETNYYGFLAADKVNVPYNFDSNIPTFSYSELSQFSRTPAVERIRELFILKRFIDARRELFFVSPDFTQQDNLKLAYLADDWGWGFGAIRAAANSGFKNNTTLSFPMPYQKLVRAGSSQHDLSPAWIYSIMRRESGFIEKIKSPAGALGLMQIMPSTARIMLSQLKLGRHSQRYILQAKTNIRLGVAYFQRLYSHYGKRLLPALAAYNAGGGKVRRWFDTKSAKTAGISVETVTIGETRRYLKAVLFYITVYSHRLGLKSVRLKALMQY